MNDNQTLDDSVEPAGLELVRIRAHDDYFKTVMLLDGANDISNSSIRAMTNGLFSTARDLFADALRKEIPALKSTQPDVYQAKFQALRDFGYNPLPDGFAVIQNGHSGIYAVD